MSDELILLIPEAPPAAPEAVTGAYRKPVATALRIGLLDNSKANADHLLRLVTERVGQTLTVTSVSSQRKNSVAIPATDSVLSTLCKEADLVVSAMAD